MAASTFDISVAVLGIVIMEAIAIIYLHLDGAMLSMSVGAVVFIVTKKHFKPDTSILEAINTLNLKSGAKRARTAVAS